MYDLEQFVKDSIRTESVIDNIKVNPDFLTGVLQLFIASGNMLDQIKKHAYYGKDYDSEKLVQEFMNVVVSLDQLKPVIQDPSSNEVPLTIEPRISHAMIGAATEGVELIESLSKYIETGELDSTNVLEEFFDIFWYSSIAHDVCNQRLDETLNMGIDKLRHRYPKKFTSENAINRDLDGERKILEKGTNQYPY